MTSTYQFLASIAQEVGVIFFMTVFLLVVLYALWPANGAAFDAAAHIPLKED